VTLLFKGLSLVNEMKCASLSYDSGESSFQMTMKPTLEMEIHTVGGSHYNGDIYFSAHYLTSAEIASKLQTSKHIPHLMHFDSSIKCFSFFSPEMHPTGHFFAQTVHPVQSSVIL